MAQVGTASGESANQAMHRRVEHDFTNHPPETPEVGALLDAATYRFLDLAHWLVDNVPPSRELSTALTKLEEVSMHTKAGIARNQDRLVPTATTDAPHDGPDA